jgi:hypothetical protein
VTVDAPPEHVIGGDMLVQAEIIEQPRRLLIPEEAAPQSRDDAAPHNGMMPPPDSERAKRFTRTSVISPMRPLSIGVGSRRRSAR